MKIVLIVIGFVFIASGAIYFIYNKPHRDPTLERSIKISSEELYNSYKSNEAEANLLYLDKVVEVTGKVIEVTANQNETPIVVLETPDNFFGVRCTVQNSQINVVPGEKITVKGICTGYLSDVIITNTVIITELD